MWADTETSQDLLNYGEVAEVIAGMLIDPKMLPLSVGISGRWGTGKSTMLKLVEAQLKAEEERRKLASDLKGAPSDQRFIVVHYDAWLYQGYDDARAALMETIASRLMLEADAEPETVREKAVSLFRRVNKLRLMGMVADAALMAAGVPTMGAISKGLGAVGRMLGGDVDAGEVKDIKEAAKEGEHRLKGVLAPKEKETPPKEIEEFRLEFGAVLADLNAVLIVFIDNLDRCLPAQVINTLEALRFFLFMGNSAFCIAADEDMIRDSVKKHFDGMEGDHVRDYLDKLIQVPVRIPRAGVPEVVSYLLVLFAEIHPDVPADKLAILRDAVSTSLQQAWNGELSSAVTIAKLVSDPPPQALVATFEMAERMAPLLVNSLAIKGNPRIIKRLLNAVQIRAKLGAVRKVAVDETVLVKLALFERCMGEVAAASLYSEILSASDGSSARLQKLQDAKPDDFKTVCPAEWQGPEQEQFLQEWIFLEPVLGGRNLRAMSALSRDTIAMVGRRRGLSEAAAEALKVLSAIQRRPSPNGTRVARSIPPAERADVLGMLMAEMRRHSDWSSPPPELNGSILLAQEDNALWTELHGFLTAHGGRNPRPWLRTVLRGNRSAGSAL